MYRISTYEMDEAEKRAIALYKRESQMLGNQRLTDLVLPDFCDTRHGDLGSWEELEKYLGAARRFAKQLRKAADARQAHYTRFVMKKVEDPAHQYWREGMNLIAADAEKKVAHWSKVSQLQFAEFVRNSPVRLVLEPQYKELEAEIDDSPTEKLDRKLVRIMPPSLSRKESCRRKKQRRRARQRKAAEEAALEQKLLSVYPTVDSVPAVTLDLEDVEAMIAASLADSDAFQKVRHINPLTILASAVKVVGDPGRMAAATRRLMRAEKLNSSANLLVMILEKDSKFRVAFRLLSQRTSTAQKAEPILCCSPRTQKTWLAFSVAAQRIKITLYAVGSYYAQHEVPKGWRPTMYLVQRLRELQMQQETSLLRQVTTQHDKLVSRTLELYKTMYEIILASSDPRAPSVGFEITRANHSKVVVEYRLS